MTEGPDASGWSARERALLAAVDLLHADRDLDDEAWARLRTHLDEPAAVEFLLLVGHYEMLATALITLRLEPDPERGGGGRRGARIDRSPAVPPAPRPLPSGQHHLAREQVVASQRVRMLMAMAEAMQEKGYVGTPVAEIIRRAGVSRETFYQQFRSKQDCFIQSLDAAAELLVQLMERRRDDTPDADADADSASASASASADADAEPVEAFRTLLHIYLRTLAKHPALARLFLVEIYAVGPEAIERRNAIQGRFRDAIADIFGAHSTEQRFACEALVAAIAQLVDVRLVADDLDGLRALEDPLVTLAARMLA
ncbi:TetR/AcrR family transcriptional regulator [Streptomyces sp. LHD-70]|uniref:TetR/AcrR family transcriptional regulator n=1 Tax=Streptomyces sp. LHD-70 TaxID=3072140 RepID=UPI00280E30E4|nr:TetR/AcrR family transcriptional regulator [Streptomyces sp. LHD-70]MDQ8705269.1 TetR/AcrR family transcriptional regulator [Streptomyces sp. LHD-70]